MNYSGNYSRAIKANRWQGPTTRWKIKIYTHTHLHIYVCFGAYLTFSPTVGVTLGIFKYLNSDTEI